MKKIIKTFENFYSDSEEKESVENVYGHEDFEKFCSDVSKLESEMGVYVKWSLYSSENTDSGKPWAWTQRSAERYWNMYVKDGNTFEVSVVGGKIIATLKDENGDVINSFDHENKNV